MEAKTGCVRRDRLCRKVICDVISAAQQLCDHSDEQVVVLAQKIMTAAKVVEE